MVTGRRSSSIVTPAGRGHDGADTDAHNTQLVQMQSLVRQLQVIVNQFQQVQAGQSVHVPMVQAEVPTTQTTLSTTSEPCTPEVNRDR
ncbi:hypothetical protein DPMN_008394 [Dreissena polymorpha]|uniref:Uncharacterized protein n=1 Tax=Dreissena polymorpha TaxID=45954 RepID=A0A9D4RWW5_DREPO|nr:hypothetical protein DPMN_008394 [Dreissena polymorpha]